MWFIYVWNSKIMKLTIVQEWQMFKIQEVASDKF